jgi:hypothetical protein
MIRQMQPERLQIVTREQLLHQVLGAGALRADPDRGAAQIREGVHGIALPPEQQQRLRFGQPSEQFQAAARGHRRSVLDEGEFLRAARATAAQASYVLDRAGGRHDRQPAVPAHGAVGEPRRERVIGAVGRSGEDRRAQIAIVVRDPERAGEGRDRRGCREQDGGTQESLPEPARGKALESVRGAHRGEPLCALLLRRHRGRPGRER